MFGAEVFLCYSQFFVKGDFIIGGDECTVDFIRSEGELKNCALYGS